MKTISYSFPGQHLVIITCLLGVLLFSACGKTVASPLPVDTSTPTAAAIPQPRNSEHTLTINNIERTYLLHIPPELDVSSPIPLVFVFHGYTSNAGGARVMSGFDRFSDANKFIVIYPDGTSNEKNKLSWNGGRCCAYASSVNVDDVGFIRQIITEMVATYSIDVKRIFATGMSNGGIFSYRLACEMADVFAAVAPVAGSLMFEPCQPSEPISLLHIHGLVDSVVPYSGSDPSNDPYNLGFTPIETGISFWAQQNGCSSEPQVTQDGKVTHTVYAPCKANTAVELYALAGVDHTWPYAELPASQVIWDFFAAHPKP
jgi:polyhydroxybutyrate depolymerase